MLYRTFYSVFWFSCKMIIILAAVKTSLLASLSKTLYTDNTLSSMLSDREIHLEDVLNAIILRVGADTSSKTETERVLSFLDTLVKGDSSDAISNRALGLLQLFVSTRKNDLWLEEITILLVNVYMRPGRIDIVNCERILDIILFMAEIRSKTKHKNWSTLFTKHL